MLRELPRTSKNTSPSLGRGAASDADMEPIVACGHAFVQFVTGVGPVEKSAGHRMKLISGPGCADEITGGMIIAWLASVRRHEIGVMRSASMDVGHGIP
jgi:hypothetical protein